MLINVSIYLSNRRALGHVPFPLPTIYFSVSLSAVHSLTATGCGYRLPVRALCILEQQLLQFSRGDNVDRALACQSRGWLLFRQPVDDARLQQACKLLGRIASTASAAHCHKCRSFRGLCVTEQGTQADCTKTDELIVSRFVQQRRTKCRTHTLREYLLEHGVIFACFKSPAFLVYSENLAPIFQVIRLLFSRIYTWTMPIGVFIGNYARIFYVYKSFMAILWY